MLRDAHRLAAARFEDWRCFMPKKRYRVPFFLG